MDTNAIIAQLLKLSEELTKKANEIMNSQKVEVKTTDEEQRELLQKEQNLTEDINRCDSNIIELNKIIEKYAVEYKQLEEQIHELEDKALDVYDTRDNVINERTRYEDLKKKYLDERDAIHKEWCEKFAQNEAKKFKLISKKDLVSAFFQIIYGNNLMNLDKNMIRRFWSIVTGETKYSDIFDNCETWNFDDIIEHFKNYYDEIDIKSGTVDDAIASLKYWHNTAA